MLFRPVLNDLARSDLNKKNKIFVLIGRKTFSAAIINTTGLKERTYAQVIGERTSGSTFFYGGVKYEILPATKLMMQYSTNFWAANEKNEGSLIPDIEIPETFKDFFICKDAALEYAISK